MEDWGGGSAGDGGDASSGGGGQPGSDSSILQYFSFEHLPEHLRLVSVKVYELAMAMNALLPEGPEKEMGFRKLLEAKDCFVRAKLS